MRLFRLRGVDVVCSPLLLAVLPAAYVLGRAGSAAGAFAALSAHEAAHAVSARRAGCRVDSIELQPFGFVARMDCEGASPADSAAVFAAGPVVSLCLAGAAALLCRCFPAFPASEAMSRFSDINLLLAAVNMLPALPLDGGRLLIALAGGGKNRKAVRLLSALGALVGAAFLLVFAYLSANAAFNPTFLLMGGFLIFAAIREGRAASPAVRHKRLGPRDAIAVRQIAMGSEVTLANAMRMLPVGAYAVVTVLDSSHRRVAALDEAELSEAASALGASATLASAVAYRGGKMV